MFRILVVEDDAQFNRNVCAYLERHGYAVDGCADGLAAWAEPCMISSYPTS